MIALTTIKLDVTIKYTYIISLYLSRNKTFLCLYKTGNCAFRKSVDGSPLPLPRVIRTKLLENKKVLDDKFNILFYGFGQWLDHDVTHALDIPSDGNRNLM